MILICIEPNLEYSVLRRHGVRIVPLARASVWIGWADYIKIANLKIHRDAVPQIHCSPIGIVTWVESPPVGIKLIRELGLSATQKPRILLCDATYHQLPV